MTRFRVAAWDNWSAPASATNTSRGLTRSSGTSREGLAVQATRKCSLPNCDRPHKGRGLCDMHVQRLRRTGTTDSPIRSLTDRFWEKVDKRGPDECWEWMGARREFGHGAIFSGDSSATAPALKAHRVSAELAGMKIEGLVVRHKCDNPPCVNPAHLETGTPAENFGDIIKRNRLARGSRRSRLTDDDVREIRRRVAAGERQADVADSFGVSRANVSYIVTRKTWGHVA